MADSSPIEWTDATWNPITGCTLVSEGCRHCYAARLAATRLQHVPSRQGLARINAAGEAKFTGEVRFNAEWLDQPLAWKRPRQIFVCAHGDLFHESVPDDWIDQVFAVMVLGDQHIFQALSKRPERARRYLSDPETVRRVYEIVCDMVVEGRARGVLIAPGVNPDSAPPGRRIFLGTWPLPNVWLGTSIEDQPTADTRIPDLLATPAAVRWLSAEPLLGPVDLNRIHEHFETMGGGSLDTWESAINGKRFDPWSDGDIDGMPKLDWVVVGGESGPGARPMHPDWARSLRDQCNAAGVPFFFKQWGAWLDADQIAARALSDDAIAHILRDGERWRPQLPLNFEDAAFLGRVIGREPVAQSDGRTLFRMTKDAAGRLLDGVEHNGMPA